MTQNGENQSQAREANARGNEALRRGDARAAREAFEKAAVLDPGQPALLFNLAAACRGGGDNHAALAALDGALALDPYFVQAMFQKGVILGDIGEHKAAARVFRDFLDTVPPEVSADPRFGGPLTHAREVVAADDAALASAIGGQDERPSRRIAAAIANLTGAAPIYRAEPTFLTVPELAAIPFFERDATPWLTTLEDGWQGLRDEALALIEDPGFVPYVANPPGTPLNQWRDLDHNRDWGALFLWKHGVRDDANHARLPATSALLGAMPLLDIPRRGPNAFFSRLAPRTRIPAHHGVTNARMTVHLPLIVPAGCGFRVGPETREWREGEAWVFDDTIEHEAWNDSDEPRVILIFDIWNPLLGTAECDHLRGALGSYDAHYGLVRDEHAEF